jgi:hypothetical protein
VSLLRKKPKDLRALKEELTHLAERVARESFDVTLDYSVESVAEVESILGQLHDEFRRTKSEEGLRGIALEFAAYLISVIERNFGKGAWNRNHPEMGSDTFPYEWNGATLFPYSWCLKRLVDGPADDVWAKFQTFVVQKVLNGRVDS